jgi:putative DNA primase/helicase
MTAAEIAAALGKARREGRGWRTECPVHHGRSLILADGRDGKLLVKCWAGCSAAAIFEELRRLDLDSWSAIREDLEAHRQKDAPRNLWAERLWERAKEARRSPVEAYLRRRGIWSPRRSRCAGWRPASIRAASFCQRW